MEPRKDFKDIGGTPFAKKSESSRLGQTALTGSHPLGAVEDASKRT